MTTSNGYTDGDPRYGSILGGRGRYDSNYVFHPEPVTFVGTEHNVDAYFFLRDLGYLSGDPRYAGAADLVKHSLLENHWNSQLHRFNQGVSLDGPDTGEALDLCSWGGLFLLAVGEQNKADDCAREITKFRVTGATVAPSASPDDYNSTYSGSGPFSGYRPYVTSDGYASPPATVWAEGTWGAILFRLRRGEDVSADLADMRGLQNIDPHHGFIQVTRGAAALPYEFHVWPAVGGTAWAGLVTHDASALWKEDGWNRSAASTQLADRTSFVISAPADAETYYWTPTVAPGVTLAVGHNGNLVARDGTGRYLGTVAYRFALDADNQDVPVTYAWNGSVVSITVAHKSSDEVTYPVLVDTNLASASVGDLEREETALAQAASYGIVPQVQLNPLERAFCKPRNRKLVCLAFYNDRTKAIRLAEHLFGVDTGQGKDGSKENAFQHAYWVALMENSMFQYTGRLDSMALALDYSIRHENRDYKSDNSELALKLYMDLQNDASGFFQMQDRIWAGTTDYNLCGRVRDLVHSGSYNRSRSTWQSGEVVWIYDEQDEIVTPDCSPAKH